MADPKSVNTVVRPGLGTIYRKQDLYPMRVSPWVKVFFITSGENKSSEVIKNEQHNQNHLSPFPAYHPTGRYG
jgi:hypothetical protein